LHQKIRRNNEGHALKTGFPLQPLLSSKNKPLFVYMCSHVNHMMKFSMLLSVNVKMQTRNIWSFTVAHNAKIPAVLSFFNLISLIVFENGILYLNYLIKINKTLKNKLGDQG